MGRAPERAATMENGAARRAAEQPEGDLLTSRSRYRRMFVIGVLTVSAVALVPLAVMSVLSYRQYRQAFRSEMTRPILRFAEAGKQSLESYLSERISTLAMVARESPYETLQDSRRLETILSDMKALDGGIVDLGVVRDDGVQVSYAGPYALMGRNYADQTWFREVATRGSYVSDVFLGYRNLPHIVIAIQGDRGAGRWFALRATIDTDVFHWLVRDRASRRPEQSSVCHRCHSLGVPAFSDAFIVNRGGVLQTPSRLYGAVLEHAPIPPLPASREAQFTELTDSAGVPLAAAFSGIDHSPFTLVLLAPRDALHAGWRPLRRDLVLFPLISGLIILGVIVGGSLYVVTRAREADRKRAALFHKMEYTNKLAAIGRLGAGVAHEINNPLSIIAQKAGLLHDLLTLSDELPPKAKILDLVESVQRSAERCGGITHRLLGFAKHMDVEREPIDLAALLREVLGFLDKEASYRSIRVALSTDDGVPTIVSDRGQLQQVFLNIINNAFAAVDDGGGIDIGIRRQGSAAVAVTIADDGMGIPKEHLEQIFDPFFTTKKGAGTGLGLSITYGIVQKLGGEIAVESEVGQGTRFTVTLPVGAA
ncbi:MAG TPA: ATP-binding protein [Longimicrobiales bacterium]|nr:ATP-binding protein [Longimicrobiales bacterium]